jgi:hypothetical protein
MWNMTGGSTKIPNSIIGILLFILGIAVAAAVTLFLNTPYDAIETKRIGSIETLVIDASRRSIIVSGNKYCAEPVPDAANTIAKEVASKLSASDGEGKNAEGSVSQLVNADFSKLFERSQGIQALRDGMYRLCEAYINNAISEDTYQEHIANLTATLNFIVPIELCSRLNKDLVASITEAMIRPVVENKPRDAKQDVQQKEISTDQNLPQVASEYQSIKERAAFWMGLMNNSELLTNKLMEGCMVTGSAFASRMAATSNILAASRYAANYKLEVIRNSPSSQTSSSGVNVQKTRSSVQMGN